MARLTRTIIGVVAVVACSAAMLWLSSTVWHGERSRLQPQSIGDPSQIALQGPVVLLVIGSWNVDHMQHKQSFTQAAKSWHLQSRQPVSFAILEFEDPSGPRWDSSLTWMRSHSLPEEGGMKSPGCTGQIVWIENGSPIHHIYFKGVSTDKYLRMTEEVFIPRKQKPPPATKRHNPADSLKLSSSPLAAVIN